MNIAYSFTEGMGHMKYFIPYMSESLSRGHSVTVFCADDQKYKNELEYEGLHDIDVVGADFSDLGPKSIMNLMKVGGPLGYISAPLFATMMSHYDQKENDLPDIIVSDFFATSARDVADSLDVPSVVLYPNPISLLGLPPPNKGSKLDSVYQFLTTYLGAPAFRRIATFFRNVERKKRKLPKLSEQDIFPSLKQTRPMIASSGAGFEYDYERSPLLHFVGPAGPTNPQPIGDKLNEWIEEQTKPIIYVSFGTYFSLNKKTLNHFVEELLSVSDNVSIIWSLSADQQSLIDPTVTIPKSWRIETWTSQWSVLAHPKVMACITHNGSNSTYECILNNIPMIACPQAADQFSNAERVKAAGIGVYEKKGANGPVGKSILEVINNQEKYTEACKKVKESLTKQGGAVKAVDLIEMYASQKKA